MRDGRLRRRTRVQAADRRTTCEHTASTSASRSRTTAATSTCSTPRASPASTSTRATTTDPALAGRSQSLLVGGTQGWRSSPAGPVLGDSLAAAALRCGPVTRHWQRHSSRSCWQDPRLAPRPPPGRCSATAWRPPPCAPAGTRHWRAVSSLMLVGGTRGWRLVPRWAGARRRPGGRRLALRPGTRRWHAVPVFACWRDPRLAPRPPRAGARRRPGGRRLALRPETRRWRAVPVFLAGGPEAGASSPAGPVLGDGLAAAALRSGRDSGAGAPSQALLAGGTRGWRLVPRRPVLGDGLAAAALRSGRDPALARRPSLFLLAGPEAGASSPAGPVLGDGLAAAAVLRPGPGWRRARCRKGTGPTPLPQRWRGLPVGGDPPAGDQAGRVATKPHQAAVGERREKPGAGGVVLLVATSSG